MIVSRRDACLPKYSYEFSYDVLYIYIYWGGGFFLGHFPLCTARCFSSALTVPREDQRRAMPTAYTMPRDRATGIRTPQKGHNEHHTHTHTHTHKRSRARAQTRKPPPSRAGSRVDIKIIYSGFFKSRDVVQCTAGAYIADDVFRHSKN